MTAPLGRILVGTDFSPGSSFALARAAVLPLAPGGEIVVVHVADSGLEAAGDPAVRSALDQAVRAVADMGSGAGKRLVRSRSCHGDPGHELGRLAAREHADLVVLGRHGHRGLLERFLGSTALRLLEDSHVPVLLAQRPAEGPYRRVVAALDAERGSEAVLDAALKMLPQGGGRLDVLHAYSPIPAGLMMRGGATERDVRKHEYDRIAAARAAVSEILRAVPGSRRVFRTHLRRGDPRVAILTEVGRLRADLVALGTGRSKGLAKVAGGVASSVLHDVSCDVLGVQVG